MNERISLNKKKMLDLQHMERKLRSFWTTVHYGKTRDRSVHMGVWLGTKHEQNASSVVPHVTCVVVAPPQSASQPASPFIPREAA